MGRQARVMGRRDERGSRVLLLYVTRKVRRREWSCTQELIRHHWKEQFKRAVGSAALREHFLSVGEGASS
jgi:hypothetical protein